ncbi:basic-leucine zipper transcription factor A [Stomoxys calcitrans]|uniref:Uncharacterized protein n=1 Tax=Stomoxys calcitrans TaxID=35570 RepID=A0A1I8PC30_STOCA|nr:basic-leucine zipper transcription factor A [Stomoxys calcitrans]
MKEPSHCLYTRPQGLPAYGSRENFPKKLFVVVLFIYCAILTTNLPQTQASPVRRTTASGQRLILHSNVYRERYHQNLLQNHRHRQQQLYQQQRQVLQNFHQYQQQQRDQLSQRPSTSYIAPILRKLHRHQQLHHHHHLHQRAAPTRDNLKHRNMCAQNSIFQPLYDQTQRSLSTIKNMSEKYIKGKKDENGEKSGKESFEEMLVKWSLHRLSIDKPQEEQYDKEFLQIVHYIYLRMHQFKQMANIVLEEVQTKSSQQSINDQDDLKNIKQFFEEFQQQISFIMNETNLIFASESVSSPSLEERTPNYRLSGDLTGRVRDFLIIRQFINETEELLEKMDGMCKTSEQNGN